MKNNKYYFSSDGNKCLLIKIICMILLLSVFSTTVIGCDSSSKKSSGSSKKNIEEIDKSIDISLSNDDDFICSLALNQIKSGNYEEAYKLLSKHDSEDAKKLLSHIIVKPTKKVYTEYDGETDTYNYVYNENGQIIKETHIQDEQYTWISEYTYYPDGIIKSYEGYDNVESQRSTCHYDRYGNTEFYQLKYSGTLQENATYNNTYDNSGNLIKVVTEASNRDSDVGSQSIYTYDDAGNILTCKRYWSGGHPASSRTYSYDNHNRIISTTYTTYDAYSLPDYKSTKEYKYDNHGNITEKKETNSQGNITVIKYTYEYDKYGNIIKKSTLNKNNFIEEIANYSYDSNNLLIKIKIEFFEEVSGDTGIETEEYFDYQYFYID